MLLVVSSKFFVQDSLALPVSLPNFSLPKLFADRSPSRWLGLFGVRPSCRRFYVVGTNASVTYVQSPQKREQDSRTPKFLRTPNASCPGRGGRGQLRFEICLERIKPRRDSFRDWEFRGDSVRCLQSVAGDAHHGRFVGMDAAFANQLFRDVSGHSAGRFREDAFGLGEQLDRANNLGVGNIFRPASGLADQLNGIRAVRRVTYRQRTRNGIRLLRL